MLYTLGKDEEGRGEKERGGRDEERALPL